MNSLMIKKKKKKKDFVIIFELKAKYFNMWFLIHAM